MKLFIWIGLALTLALLLAGCQRADSQANEDLVSWEHPTTREDGSPLALSEIDATLINWGPSGGPYTDGSLEVNAPAASAAVSREQVPGNNRCYVLFTRDTDQRISDATAEVCKRITGRPNPPRNPRVQ